MNLSLGEQKLTFGLQQKGGKDFLKADGDLGKFQTFSPTEPNKIEIPHPLKYGSVGFSSLAETQSRNKNPNPCGL